jgi:type VI secretion system protein ImpA
VALPEDLLIPIPGPNPSGESLRFDPLYDRLKEARREESQPPLGMTEQDRKIADYVLVIKLATDALKKRTKDCQIAAWLIEALTRDRGFSGLKQGLATYQGLLVNFWDTVHPELEDGRDPQNRLASLGFLETKLEIPLKLVPVVEQASYSYLDYRESREVGTEEQAKTDEAKKKRLAHIKEKKLLPEVFDKAFAATAKQFYFQAEKDLDDCLRIVEELRVFCNLKFEDGPSFNSFLSALTETRHLIHGFLQKKRETEPDPPEPVPVSPADVQQITGAALAPATASGILIALENSSEPADRVATVRMIADAAAALRQREPLSPAAFLMLRGLRWGELRAAVSEGDPRRLEAPPTELRKHLKRLALEEKWQQLLETAESAMALPCSRAWLDLQRYVIEACTALGQDYELIARAIRSELNALLKDLPELLDANLSDDTPVANSDTRAWLKSLFPETATTASSSATATPRDTVLNGYASAWPGQMPDARARALQALRDGQSVKAFEILQVDLNQQRSGRERFKRKLQLVEVCVSTSNQNIAQPLLDDLSAMIENHKLDDWEDPKMVADALAVIMKSSTRIQADKGQQQKIFERICRLNVARAVGDA